MGYDEVASQRDRFVYHGFGHVKTQQSPCCFRLCQSYLQAGIVISILQWQRREPIKGVNYLLNCHNSRKFAAKVGKRFQILMQFGEFCVGLQAFLVLIRL